MILLVHSDKSSIKDFIMWADVEFAMQLELLQTRDFKNQDVAIMDLTDLGKTSIGGPLFVICHGSPYSPLVQEPSSVLDKERYTFLDIGGRIGARLAGANSVIELWACYGADGPVGRRAVDRFAAGLRQHKSGVTVRSYLGSTVTNTIATVSARETPNNANQGAVLVVDEAQMGTAGSADSANRALFHPQASFDAFLQQTPGAGARQKAIRAADGAEKFYAAFTSQTAAGGAFYPVGNAGGQPVVVIS